MSASKKKTDDYITLAECARRLGRSRALISRWAQQGRLKVKRVAGQPFVRECDCKLPEFRPPGPKPKS